MGGGGGGGSSCIGRLMMQAGARWKLWYTWKMVREEGKQAGRR